MKLNYFVVEELPPLPVLLLDVLGPGVQAVRLTTKSERAAIAKKTFFIWNIILSIKRRDGRAASTVPRP